MRKLIVCLFVLFSHQSIAASFDCNKATTKVEKGICASKDISDLDKRLAWYYKKYYKYKTGAQRKTFRTTQLAWLRERDDNCNLAKNLQGCLKTEYEKRIDVIHAENHFLSKDMKVSRPELSTYLKSTGKFEIGSKFPEYYVITQSEFIIAIDWAQGGKRQHGLYFVNLQSNTLEKVLSGYPNFDGIYQDNDRTVIVATTDSQRAGLGWQQISAIELHNGLITTNKVVSYEYYALDGDYDDECYDTSTANNQGRLDVVGRMESLNIVDVDSDGYRDVSVVIDSKDCKTLKKSKETLTFASKKYNKSFNQEK